MDKGNKIKYGYADKFYCFKIFNDNSLEKMISKLDKVKCIITKFDYAKKEIKIKDTFQEFIDKEEIISKNKFVADLNNELRNEFPDIAITDMIKINNHNNTKNENDDSNSNAMFDIALENVYSSFIYNNLALLCDTLTSSSRYLGKPVDLFMMSFLIQPIKIKYNNKDYLINAKTSVYSTGNLIIQYTIPMENVEFKYLCNDRNNKMDIQSCIPQYMINNSISYDYSKEEYTLEEVIDIYNNYILRFLKINLKSNVANFTNYTLVDYDGIPETFDGMSIELSRNIFWILNHPFGYLNEKEKDTYKNLHKGRHAISIYSSLFVSSYQRSVVLYDKLQPSEELIKEWFNNRRKYESALIYLFPSIEMILIKKSFYNLISHERFDEGYSTRKLRKKYFDIIKANDYLFHIRYGGYGSIAKLQEFLESNLTDYLPAKHLEDNIKRYKEILEIAESNKTNRNNFLVAIIAMLFPIIFGLNAIETMTKSLDNYLSTNLESYSLKLWIAIILFIGLCLSINLLKKLLNKIIIFTIQIKFFIKFLFNKIRNRCSRSLKK